MIPNQYSAAVSFMAGLTAPIVRPRPLAGTGSAVFGDAVIVTPLPREPLFG